MKIKSQLSTIIQNALKDAEIQTNENVVISDATKPEFGDYQFNGAMKLAKTLKKNPREIATNIVNNIDTSDIIKKVEIAGPGFINIWLDDKWLSQKILKLLMIRELELAL